MVLSPNRSEVGEAAALGYVHARVALRVAAWCGRVGSYRAAGHSEVLRRAVKIAAPVQTPLLLLLLVTVLHSALRVPDADHSILVGSHGGEIILEGLASAHVLLS